MLFPFHFSSLNYELAQSTPSGSLNILWNQLNQKSIANSMMYMTPTFDFSIGYEYPEFGMFGNNLLNPLLAIQQTMQAFQNGNWMNGMNNWGNWQMPWGTTPSGDTTSNSEYDALKALITKYKEIGTKNSSLSPSLLDKINNALNKSGKPEEKLAALKEVYNQLNKNKLEQALLELPEYKEMLVAAGYKFEGTNKEEDKTLKQELNSMEQDIKSGKADKLILTTVSETNPHILRIVSYWNDTHSDENSRGIIRLVANNLPAEKTEQENHRKGIRNLAMSLVNKVEDFKSEVSGDFSKLDKAQKDVSEALTAAEKDFTKEKLMELADKFDTLYAMLRMMEAEKIRNTIKTKYSFLNNISSSDKDFVDDNLVMDETKADLKSEGIKVIPEVDNIQEEEIEEEQRIDEENKTAEEKAAALVEQNELRATDKEGVYVSTTTSEGQPVKFYTIKGEKLVELKDVKKIDKDGKCTLADGSQKELKDVETKEVTAQDVVNYNKTLKRINELKTEGTLVKCSTNLPDGTVLYRSKGKLTSGDYQYFVVRDNELKRIVCDYVEKDGTVIIDGVKKAYQDLCDENFETISDSDIVTEDLQEKAKEEKVKKEKEELEAVFTKEFTAHEDNDGETYGKDIANYLECYTDKDEWDDAVKKVAKLDGDNIYSAIKGYEEEKNCVADSIIRQIRTENGRADADKMKLIVKIIDSVWEYCKKYGTNSEDACRDLYELKQEIDKNPTQLISVDKAEDLDEYILRIFGLN